MKNLLELIDAEVQTIHEETGRSLSLVRTTLGVAGPELKSKRSENTYNAWVHVRMKEVNDDNQVAGRERLSMTDFKEEYGHEYGLVTPAERESNFAALGDLRQLQHPTDRKVLKATQVDIDSTMSQVQDVYMPCMALKNAYERKSELKRTVVECLKDSLHECRSWYVNFREQIELGHGVELVGWPLDEVSNPSKLGKENLGQIYDGLTATPPTIFFQKLTKEQIATKKAAFKQGKVISVLTPPEVTALLSPLATADSLQQPITQNPAPAPVASESISMNHSTTPATQLSVSSAAENLEPLSATVNQAPLQLVAPSRPTLQAETPTTQAPMTSSPGSTCSWDDEPGGSRLTDTGSVESSHATSSTAVAGHKRPLPVDSDNVDSVSDTHEPGQVSKKQKKVSRDAGPSEDRDEGRSQSRKVVQNTIGAEVSPEPSTPLRSRSGRIIKRTECSSYQADAH
ncbi:hypothetical protein FRC03_005068 [Tulasnella sp. 419]|nr:hypothetical protein FRC03_005068 [Tulasnella sp. 419]